MKPFDIELAKAGHPVCTRSEKPVRILCFDRKSTDGCSIMALIDEGEFEDFMSFNAQGRFYEDARKDENDLFMAPVKKEGWINIYKDGDWAMMLSNNIYKSKEDALDLHTPVNYLDTVKIEWEE